MHNKICGIATVAKYVVSHMQPMHMYMYICMGNCVRNGVMLRARESAESILSSTRILFHIYICTYIYISTDIQV